MAVAQPVVPRVDLTLPPDPNASAEVEVPQLPLASQEPPEEPMEPQYDDSGFEDTAALGDSGNSGDNCWVEVAQVQEREVTSTGLATAEVDK